MVQSHLQRDEVLFMCANILNHLKTHLQICINKNKESLLNVYSHNTFRQQLEGKYEILIPSLIWFNGLYNLIYHVDTTPLVMDQWDELINWPDDHWELDNFIFPSV